MQFPKERFQTFMPLRVYEQRERIKQYNLVNYKFKKVQKKWPKFLEHSSSYVHASY